MAAETKVSVTYEHTDGSKETRSISNLNPEATNEVLLNMMNQFTGLQDAAVKMVKTVKRVDSTSLMQRLVYFPCSNRDKRSLAKGNKGGSVQSPGGQGNETGQDMTDET